MKRLQVQAILVLALVWAPTAVAQGIFHQFQIWGRLQSDVTKQALFFGWTNGFFMGRGESALPLQNCLQGLSLSQITAMIDKYYQKNPERWSQPIGIEIYNALTVPGSPCPVIDLKP